MSYSRHGAIVLWLGLLTSCAAVTPPAEFSTMDASPDQWRIAEAYSREALRFRQKAQDLNHRVVYEQLFGKDSEWVSGARVLAQSYEDAAQEHERLAQQHLDQAGGQRMPRVSTPTPALSASPR